MQPKKSWGDKFSDGVPWVVPCALSLAAVEVFIDWVTWVQLNLSIVYSLPLVILAVARKRQLLWGLAFVLIIMTFAVYSYQIPPGVFSLHEPFFIDRILSAVTIILTAGLLHAWTLALDALRMQRQSIRAKNDQLEVANRELVRYEEEISRQNEELKRRREEAEEASKRKTELLASVSHDIRTPVNTIHLAAELIRDAGDNPDLVAEIPLLAKDLQTDAVSLLNFVSDALDIASLDSGRISLRESEFCLNDLLAEECARLRTLAQTKKLSLSVEMPQTLVEVRTDRTKLVRILDNLIGNAIKFTATGGITVTADLTPESAIQIQVTDTGPGIDSTALGQIFDGSVQLRSHGEDHQRGWGLGLAICRRLAALMGGDISVESRLNRGSTFKVTLPPSCVLNRLNLESELSLGAPKM